MLAVVDTARVSFRRKHSSRIAAKGKPVFLPKGVPCIEVVTHVVVNHMKGVELIDLVDKSTPKPPDSRASCKTR